MAQSDFFFVYDYKMKNFLSDKGHRYVTHAISIKNNKKFWLFVINEDMKKDIEHFNQR